MTAPVKLLEDPEQPIFATPQGTTVPTVRRQPRRTYVVAGLIASASVFGTLPVPTPADAEVLRAAVSTTRTAPDVPPQGPSTTDNRSVSGLLQRVRRNAQLNWGDVARALGVSRRTIHNWLSGAQVAGTHMSRLVELAALVDRSGGGGPAETRILLTEPGPRGRSPLDEFALTSRPTRKVPLSTVSAGDLLGGDEPGTPATVEVQAPSRRSSLEGRPVPRRRPNQS